MRDAERRAHKAIARRDWAAYEAALDEMFAYWREVQLVELGYVMG